MGPARVVGRKCGSWWRRALGTHPPPPEALHNPFPVSLFRLGVAFCTGSRLRTINHVALSLAVKENEVESHGNDDS